MRDAVVPPAPAREPQAAARLRRGDRRSGSRRCSLGLFGGVGGSGAAALLGLGMIVMIFGVALLAPVLVRPLARIIGAPLERLQGMPGRLARENAERQPQRTAITASALMIGLALVVFTAIFAAGLRGSIDKVIDEQFSRSALIVTHDDGFSPVPPGVSEQLEQTEGRRPSSRRCASTRPTSRAAATRSPPPGVEPATVTQLFEPEIAAGRPADARRAARRPGVRVRLVGREPRLRGRRHARR